MRQSFFVFTSFTLLIVMLNFSLLSEFKRCHAGCLYSLMIREKKNVLLILRPVS